MEKEQDAVPSALEVLRTAIMQRVPLLRHSLLRWQFVLPQVETLRWVTGLYLLIIGLSFLLLPQGKLSIWIQPIWLVGAWMLLSGLALLWIGVLSIPTWVHLVLSITMTIPLLLISGVYVWLGAPAFAIPFTLFSVGILLMPFSPPIRHGEAHRPDGLGVLLGVIVAMQGLDFLFGSPSLDTLFALISPTIVGIVFLLSGGAVVVTQYVPQVPSALLWLAHMLCGLAVIALQTAVALFLDPLYWLLGVATLLRGCVILLLPWLSNAITHFDARAFRPRLALALVTTALLAVSITLPVVLSALSRQSIQELVVSRQIAFGCSLLVLLLAGVGGWWLAGGLLAPLSRLMRDVHRIAEGGGDSTILPSPQEISELARLRQAVDRMAHALEARIQERVTLSEQLVLQEQAFRAVAERNEARIRRLLESNIIGIIFASETTIIEANDAFLMMLGASREDLVAGRIDWVAITPPEYTSRDRQALQELRERGVCTPFEKEYIRCDGSRVPILIGAAVVEQEPPQWICFILDLSPQKQAEQERLYALEAFQTLADHAPDAITRHDAASFRYLYVNPGAERAIGLQAIDLLGKTYWDVGMTRDLCVFFDQALTTVAKSRQSTQVTYQDSGRYYQSLLVPEEDATQHLSSILVISRDVTTLRHAHQQTEQALHALISVAQALVLDRAILERDSTQDNFDDRVTILRHVLEVICFVLSCVGAILVVVVPDTEQVDLLLTNGFPSSVEEELMRNVKNLPLMHLFVDTEIPTRLRAGESIHLDTSDSCYVQGYSLTSNGLTLHVPMRLGTTLTGILTLFGKESQERFTEEQRALAGAMGSLLALLIEREHLFVTSEEAVARELAAHHAAQQMDAFLGIVSHELKTPLTAMKGNMQLVARKLARFSSTAELHAFPDAFGSQLATILQLIERSQRQLGMQTRLVNDLLDGSRIQSDRLELQLGTCDLIQLVSEAIEDQRVLVPNRQINLHVEDQDVLVWADAGRVGQVLTNYLTNALKYSDASQAVDVQVVLMGAMAQVSVKDRGPGLTQEQQQQLWNRFYRVPGITVKSGSGVGLGLGLYICRHLIERQGGQVGVERVPVTLLHRG